jgi:hypothetical protein
MDSAIRMYHNRNVQSAGTVTDMASFFGLYRGTILYTTDPSQMGRVQVMVPAISGQVSGWALPCQSGSPCNPKVGDTAWVVFEGGDPTHPVFMGILPS